MLRCAKVPLLIAVIGLCAGLMAQAARAQTEPVKIALLIGNQNYDRSVGELKNPHNDVAVVAEALTKQGFRVLPLVKEARRSAILGAVRDLVRQLNAAGSGAIGFLYYSGHGAAESDTGFNYLIPIDAKEPGSATFWDDSLKLDDVLKLLDGAKGAAKFIVFDACRNELRVPAKSTSKGLLPVAEQQGMFIAYASAPGRTASDAGAASGPYAAALAAELGKSGQDHLNLFQNVKEAVLSTTGGSQQPWESNGLGRRIYLTGLPQAAVQAPAAAPQSQATSGSGTMSEAALAWERVRQSRSPAVLEAFAKQFPGTVYAAEAQERLTELRAAQTAVASPQPAPPGKEVAVAEPPQATRCTGVEMDVAGTGTRCLDPAAADNREFQDCFTAKNGTRLCGPRMVLLPKGRFRMGSPQNEVGRLDNEGPVRDVEIRQPFAAGRTHVTRGEFAAFIRDSGHRVDPGCQTWTGQKWELNADATWQSPGFEQTDTHPVICVNWNDAKAYVAWLAGKTGVPYRLLSEAEAEYAARGVTRTSAPHPRYWFGDDEADLCANANGADQTAKEKVPGASGWSIAPCRDGHAWTSPVASFRPNAFGLYDVAGNVWSWTEDCWINNYKDGPVDERARTTGCSQTDGRVLRGGSWLSYPQILRSADRDGSSPDDRDSNIGFRVARSVSR